MRQDQICCVPNSYLTDTPEGNEADNSPSGVVGNN